MFTDQKESQDIYEKWEQLMEVTELLIKLGIQLNERIKESKKLMTPEFQPDLEGQPIYFPILHEHIKNEREEGELESSSLSQEQLDVLQGTCLLRGVSEQPIRM